MYEFDLKTLWKVLKGKRKMLIRNCVIGAVVAVIIGYSIPKEYASDVILAAEVKEDSPLGSGAASLASLAGIDLGGGSDAIGPKLYPNVVSSNAFIVGLLECNVMTKDSTFVGTYRKYLKEKQRAPWWNYPGQLLGKLMSAIKGNDGGEQVEKPLDPQCLSASENGMVGGVRGTVICAVDDNNGTISISARSQDPLVAKILVDSAMNKLQDFITLYRTNKARNDLKYYQGLEADALRDYRKAQQDYAHFNDSHRDIALQAYMNERQRLENDVQMAFTAYSQMRQQVLMAVAKVQENTPAFTVIEAASVPSQAETPRKKLILIAVLFLTFLGSLGWIYFRLLFFPTEEQKRMKEEGVGQPAAEA